MSAPSQKKSPSHANSGDGRAGESESGATDFGANDWLVEEQYEQFLEDKESVSPEWRELFDTYTPDSANGNGGSTDRSNGAAKSKSAASGRSQTEQSRSTSKASQSGSAHKSESSKNVDPSTDKTRESKTSKSSSSDGVKDTSSKTESGTGEKSEVKESTASTSKEPQGKPSPTPRDAPARKNLAPQAEAQVTPLRGATARVVSNMEASLAVPTATSVRALPAKLLIDNRTVINNHLSRSRGGKVSFTHLIGYAMVKALEAMPAMNNGFAEQDGKPVLVEHAHINIGLAIDVPKPDGTRQLLVPGIKSCEGMDFHNFWEAYEEVVRKARDGKLAVDDFQGISVSLTNPGGIGTVHSVPRLMQGQGAIIGVGALAYPAEWQGASPERFADNAVS